MQNKWENNKCTTSWSNHNMQTLMKNTTNSTYTPIQFHAKQSTTHIVIEPTHVSPKKNKHNVWNQSHATTNINANAATHHGRHATCNPTKTINSETTRLEHQQENT